MTHPHPSPHPLAEDPALRKRLVGLARHWLAHGDEAEDLVQETYLRTASGALPPAPGSREAWLVTVLHHLCIDVLRRRGRQERLLAGTSNGAQEATDEDGPERLAEQAQGVERALAWLVHTLVAGEVAAVLLHEVFGWSHAELGALTGRSEAASRQQLHRVLLRLRQARSALAPHAPWTGHVQTPEDEDGAYLFALCQQALVRRDPAGLVAVLRATRPQAMALPNGTQPLPHTRGWRRQNLLALCELFNSVHSSQRLPTLRSRHFLSDVF